MSLSVQTVSLSVGAIVCLSEHQLSVSYFRNFSPVQPEGRAKAGEAGQFASSLKFLMTPLHRQNVTGKIFCFLKVAHHIQSYS